MNWAFNVDFSPHLIQKNLVLSRNGRLADHRSSHPPTLVRLCLTLCVLTQTFPCHTSVVTAMMFGPFELDCKYVIFMLTVETTFC